MAISTEFGHQSAVSLHVMDIGKIAYPAAQRGLQYLFTAVGDMVDLKIMQFVETNLLQLPERVRRLFSHFGAVRGLDAGYLWAHYSHDATNVVYASVWELWKLEEVSGRFPICRSITNVNTAGNVVEALLGIAWIFRYELERSSFMSKISWLLWDESQQDSVGYHGSFFSSVQELRRYSAEIRRYRAKSWRYSAKSLRYSAKSWRYSVKSLRYSAEVRRYSAESLRYNAEVPVHLKKSCLLYTSDAADE